jgi:hypothetical protein
MGVGWKVAAVEEAALGYRMDKKSRLESNCVIISIYSIYNGFNIFSRIINAFFISNSYFKPTITIFPDENNRHTRLAPNLKIALGN